MDTFQWLINPTTIETFSQDYWERSYLLIKRHSPNYFASILTDNDLSEFFARRNVTYPFIRITKNGEVIHKDNYLKPLRDSAYNLVDIDKALSYYNTGGTIILQKAQLLLAGLTQFIDKLECEIKIKIDANIYVTPKDSRGFFPHFDTHDVFVLQIHGTKHWNLYDMPVRLPLSGSSLSAEEVERYRNTTEKCEVNLRPGDLLYIPRGLIHDAYTSQSDSVHITIGFHPYLLSDFLKKILSDAGNYEPFRRALPVGFSTDEERDFFLKNIKTLIKHHIDSLSVESLLKTFEFGFLSERLPNTNNKYRFIKLPPTLDLTTTISVNDSLSHDILKLEDGGISLLFHGKRINFPGFTEESLRSLVTKKTLKIKEIDGSIDDKSKVILSEKLLVEGFIKIESNEI